MPLTSILAGRHLLRDDLIRKRSLGAGLGATRTDNLPGPGRSGSPLKLIPKLTVQLAGAASVSADLLLTWDVPAVDLSYLAGWHR